MTNKNIRAAQSQDITDRATKNLQNLGATLGEQKNILDALRVLATELVPHYESASPLTNLPPEHEQEFNNILRDIDAITQSLTGGQNRNFARPRKQKNMV